MLKAHTQTENQLRQVQQQVTTLQETALTQTANNRRNPVAGNGSELIDKPHGNFNLEDAIGLEHDKYLSLRVHIIALSVMRQE